MLFAGLASVSKVSASVVQLLNNHYFNQIIVEDNTVRSNDIQANAILYADIQPIYLILLKVKCNLNNHK